MVAVRENPRPRTIEGIRQAEAAWRSVCARWDDRFGLGLQDFILLREERYQTNRDVLKAYALFFGNRVMDIVAPDDEHRLILAEERAFERMLGARAAAERRQAERHQEQLKAAYAAARAVGDTSVQYVTNDDGWIVYPAKQQDEDIKFILVWADLNGWPELDVGPTIAAFKQRVARPEHYQALPIYLTVSSGERAWRGLLRWLPGSWKYLPMLIRGHLDTG